MSLVTVRRLWWRAVLKRAFSQRSRSPSRSVVWSVEAPKAQYGGRHIVTMLPGSGTGPEMMRHVRDVFKDAGVPVDFEEIIIDSVDDDVDDDLGPAITSIRRNGAALKGNVETGNKSRGFVSRNVTLRNQLDLYVNVVGCKSFPGVNSRHKGVDVVIVRQNTEGEYSFMEHESVRGVVESMKVVTADNADRVVRFAFEYARINARKKVTTVHKASMLKASDGLFLATAQAIAEEYPGIIHDDMIIDHCCMHLVSNPRQFDVMVMTNLYGAIVSNILCGLVRGVGLLSGSNYGDQCAVFEPGSRKIGRTIAGKNVANPTAMLNASVDMLYHLRLNKYATRIAQALDKTLNVDRVHTPDLGGKASSSDVVQSIISNLKEQRIIGNQH